MTEFGEAVSGAFAFAAELLAKAKAHPCDVDKLTLEVTGQDEGGTKPLVLEVDRERHDEGVDEFLLPDIVILLKRYDMIIDCLAEPQAAESAKPAKVGGKASYAGLQCMPSSHAHLALTDKEAEEPTIEQQVNAASVTIAPVEFFTSKFAPDPLDTNDKSFGTIRNVFAIIKGFLLSSIPHFIELEATGCGIRSDGDDKRPNGRLIGLVRVIPRSEWTFVITVPPLGKFSYSREKRTDFIGDGFKGVAHSSRSTEVSAGFDHLNHSTSSTSSGEGVLGVYEHTETTKIGESIDSYEYSRDVKDGSVATTFKEQHSDSVGQSITNVDGSVTQKNIDERLSPSSGLSLTIRYNGAEIDCEGLIERIKKEIDIIGALIASIRELFNSMPQIGWKFTFDISVFAGTISLNLITRHVDGAKANGRYLAVEYELTGTIDIKIIDVSLSLSFGADIRALKSGIVAKAVGTLGIEVSVSTDINMGRHSSKKEILIKANSTVKISVVAFVSLLGKTLADAKIEVDTGLELEGGKLTIELGSSPKCDLEGKLKMKPVMLTGFIIIPCWFDEPIEPYELARGRELYQFS